MLFELDGEAIRDLFDGRWFKFCGFGWRVHGSCFLHFHKFFLSFYLKFSHKSWRQSLQNSKLIDLTDLGKLTDPK